MDGTRYVYKGSLWYALVIILRYFLVSLLPFVSTLLRSSNNIAAWSHAVWQSLAILIAVGTISVVIARSFKMTVITQEGKIMQIETSRGVIIKAKACYLIENSSCMMLREDILTVIGGSVGVRIIPSRKNDKAIFKIRLSGKNAKQFDRLMGGKTNNKVTYKTGIIDVLCHAFISSNAIGEIIVLMPAIRYIGKLFGQNTAYEIYGVVDSLAQHLLYFVPYALATVVFVAIIGWTISFLRIFASNFNTALLLQKDTNIRQGLIFKRKIHIEQGAMAGKCIRLTPVGYILKRFDVFALLPHIAKNKGGQFIGMYKIKKRAVPKCFKRDKAAFYPKKRMWYKFIMWPFYLSAITAAIFLPAYKTYLSSILILLPVQIIALYWLAIEIANYKLCYFKIEDGYYKGVCRKGLSIIYVCIPTEKATITITQSIFQKRDKSCNIKIISAYSGNIFKIRNLDFEKLSTFSTGFST